MKTSHSASILAAMALVPLAAQAESGSGNGGSNAKIPSIPTANFAATPKIVQAGTYPTLTWAIVYPSSVADVATVSPPGTITLTNQVYVDVRAVGVGVTGSRSGTDNDVIPAESRMSVNGSDYFQLFYGTNSDVDPGHSLYTKKLNKGTTINFGGRYVNNGEWSDFFTTRNTNFQVVALADGDAIPTTFDLPNSGRLAEYLKPYVDGSGKVDIGPMSLLILAEYAETSHSNPNFDLQDMALLVSFSYKNNNGHGNNIDGVDVSNPGQGGGGPNGGVDPSGDVDDEGKIIR